MLEIIVLVGTFLLLIVIGALSAFSESFSRKRESKWAFPAAGTVQNANRTIQPIDEASSFRTTVLENNIMPEVQLEDNTILYKQIVNNNEVVNYSHSEITGEVSKNLNQLVDNINSEMNNYTFERNESQLNNEFKNKIEEFVGEKTANLVTNNLTDLEENKQSVIIGLFDSEDNTIHFEGSTLKLSLSEPIVSGENDYLLLKGTLLPNGEFRVIHYDDAETVEHGYGVESFVLDKTA
ncbi:hypothetical protein [Lysinibacillus sphaericus]|uniref:hypothetical protein n=1 Tax=Lysinibacillus sphaericus TaxID=1421 RepID=UPI000C1786E8|nr:hypothetical protein [Lysinibacillus sphaericus]PIJ97997.1 hypothetical protein CTN02_09645 [Lysinibacillus sphaericus]